MSEHLKYKMYDHEVVPPGSAWKAIEEELDGQGSLTPLAGKIYGYEVTPPSAAWNTITSALDETAAEPLAPVRKMPVRSPVRWIAAAVIMFALLTGSYYLLNNGTVSNSNIASVNTTINTDQTIKTSPDISTQSATSPGKPGAMLASYLPVRKKVSSVKERPLRCSHIEESNTFTDDMVISVTPGQILSESGEPIRDMSVVNPSNNKYISITAPNGQQTRISSKLAIAMPYFGITDAESKSAQTENSAWKLLIQEWRNKIMHSAFTPSSSNFMDILEFSELIKD